MGDKVNLASSDAVKKLQDMAKEVRVCMFCTYDSSNRLQTAPMSANKVDDDGNIWFISDKNSKRNTDLAGNNTTDLIFGDPAKENYISVHGTSEILFDKEIIKELWNPIIKTWFQGGVDDPNISVIKVTTDDAYYWDTKHGKMVSFIKIMAGAVTGKTMDDGIEGKLSL